MPRRYHLDARNVPLDSMRRSLASRRLIPSRVPLQDQLDERFAVLSEAGLSTVADLLDRLKSKQAIERFHAETGLPVEYLTLLKREAKSYFPNPVPLARFPRVPQNLLKRLEKKGLKHSKHLFEHVDSEAAFSSLHEEVGGSREALRRLAKLADLARLYGIGPVFADLLLETGVESVDAFLGYEPGEVVALYESRMGKKADFTEEDIRFTLKLARHLAEFGKGE